MSDFLGGACVALAFFMICLGVAITDQYKLEKQRKKREKQLLIEQHERELEANAVARYKHIKNAQTRWSVSRGPQVQAEIDRYARQHVVVVPTQKPKANRKYGAKYA
ncbi:hypothetical protein [Streptococcus marmotae]|uniref:hypothetical protein n=1 Tax=Streptococcus marmotae TaxID=1825069 RepID=UPI00082F6914|nr:hypothetical protein [Streptococcus marmotae]QBX16893.1 hypothetical protein Javan291_0017 [Streptococcus phage Javan291]